MEEKNQSYSALPERIAFLRSLSDEEVEAACASVTWEMSEQAKTFINVTSLCHGLYPEECVFEYVRGYRDFKDNGKSSEDDQYNIYYMAGYWDAQRKRIKPR
jgi:hypothetical protein